MNEAARWAVLPAAGSGQRYGADIPKQYQLLRGVPVAEYSLRCLLQLRPKAVVVALAADDSRWQGLPSAADPRVETVAGGSSRATSVLAGLAALLGRAADDDWVLVHDIVRPCIEPAWIQSLLDRLGGDPCGGLPALPVDDSLHRGDESGVQVVGPVDRSGLWRAQTPQIFRFAPLYRALHAAVTEGRSVGDEAAAMQAKGHAVRLLEGAPTNIKITFPADLLLAEAIMAAGGGSSDTAPMPAVASQ